MSRCDLGRNNCRDATDALSSFSYKAVLNPCYLRGGTKAYNLEMLSVNMIRPTIEMV